MLCTMRVNLLELLNINYSINYQRNYKNSFRQKKKLYIPLDRLNKAIRRKELVDKAIELGIAMDSIFLSKEKELTYKSKLRAAWLLGKTFEERKQIMNLFDKLYKIRSDAVHDGIVKQKNANDLIQQGIQKVAETIEIIIKNKCVPNWEEIVLGQS